MHCEWGRKPPKLPLSFDFVIFFEEDRATVISNMHKIVMIAHLVREISWPRATHTQTCSSQYFATASAAEVILANNGPERMAVYHVFILCVPDMA